MRSVLSILLIHIKQHIKGQCAQTRLQVKASFYFMCVRHMSQLSWFPRAAVMKYHRLGGLKQQKFVFSQFWIPEI